MHVPPLQGAPWDRKATIVLFALVLACAASLLGLVHPWYEATRETADGSIYLVCARSLLAGEGYSVLGQPFTVRPPGFSLLLAPVLALRGLDFQALNLLVASFGVLAAACLFVLARPSLGDAGAAALALVLWLNPGFRHLSNQVMSDVPGLALALACLVLRGWAARRPSLRRDLALGVAIALAAYVRTAAVLIVPAEIVVRLLARRDGDGITFSRFVRSRVLALVAVPLLLLAPWSVRNAVNHPPWPAEQTLLASYSTGMWHVDGGDPSSPSVGLGEVLARVPEQLPRILAHLGGRLDPQAAGDGSMVLGASLAIALLLAAYRGRSAPAVFALLLLGTLAVYFAVDGRLALPVFALGLLAAAEVVSRLLQRATGPRAARGIVAGLLLLLAAHDAAPRRDWEAIRAAHAADLAYARAIGQRLSPADVLAAPAGWHLSVLLDRPVWNLAHAGRREVFAGSSA
jgi:4-amino-4-deoxy-L-arabinose transferase-like glycosyltransferase